MEEKKIPAQPAPVIHHKLNLSRTRYIIIIVLFSILSLGVGYSFGAKGYEFSPEGYNVNISRELPQEKKDLSFSLFWDTWDTIHESYFAKDQLVESDLVFGAIKGMVAAVGDPYTVFLTPDEQRITQEDLSGNFSGVGIQIGFKGSQLAVVAPLQGSPAETAGIQAGDIIAGIKDEEKGIERGTVGITLPDAVQTIRGKAGSVVTLSLLRDGSDTPIVVDVRREEISVPSVELSFVGDDENIAHLKVLKFGGETLAEWDKSVIEILQKQNLGGIILDVRNNPGGYLQGAVDLGSEFLEDGEVVVTEEYANGTKSEFYVERMGRLTNDNLVVLINGGSASASEILSGALRDLKDTPLVGTTSFGKGTVQEAKKLPGEVGLHITVARWITPSGTWVNDEPLVPDYEIEQDIETLEDEQLDRAIQVLSGDSLSGAL